ncbi:MAG: hypothetical protein GF317_02705 [Candidatus Lokiarchaeota archaeon]|nr:hypothetical protein [Candidatus Lokiarchaeota archaeon]MBD3198817.1 hypothetical protein [Candidatus Lokiarchaeota archaeon]
MLRGRKSGFSDDSLVKIKPKAYYNMLVHVLRFGAKTKPRNQYREVMGMLIGRLEGEGDIKNVIVEDAVPVSHGGSIEVTFAPQDYVTFSAIDEEFTKQNLFTIGWYHSHPGLDIFFSSTDIKNQLGWQNPNPSAIGIVFDHTYLERSGDMGFRTFRLSDPSKGDISDYHQVKTIVEPPEDIDFYEKIVSLIESVRTKEPPIFEINEKPSLFGDIAIPSNKALIPGVNKLNTESIINNLIKGFSDYIKTTLNPLVGLYNEIKVEIIEEVSERNILFRNNIGQIITILEEKMEVIQNAFSESLQDKINNLDFYIDDKLEEIDNKQGKIRELSKSQNTELLKKVDSIFKEIISNYTQEVGELRQKIISGLKEVTNKRDTYAKKLEDYNDKLNSHKNKLNEFNNNQAAKIKENQKIFEEEIKNTLETIEHEVSTQEKRNSKILSELDDQISILESSVGPLRDKIEDLKTDKQVLQNKLEKLNSTLTKTEKDLNKANDENKSLKEELDKLNDENKEVKKQMKKLEKEVKSKK